MARKWEQIIPYEDRSIQLTTTNWRLSGFRTDVDNLNNDSGVLWLGTSKSGDNVTCTLYKDSAAANSVATALAVDVSGTDNTGANDVLVTFTAANSSGLSGTMMIRDYQGDSTAVPLCVALCVDEDCTALFGALDDLSAFDETEGMADIIRVAHGDVMARVMQLFMDELGGYGAQEAWFIDDADRTYPDLRKISNPDQLRQACAYRTLDLAIRRDHLRADPTMYSETANHWAEQYEAAIGGLRLAFKPGSGDDADESSSSGLVRLRRK